MAATDRPNLGLRSRWTPGDDGWSGTPGVDGNFDRLDSLVNLAVISQTDTPPGSPADGDRYLCGDTPTGAWDGHAQEVAVYLDGAWIFYEPREGWLAWVGGEALFVFTEDAWAELETGGGGGGGGNKTLFFPVRMWETTNTLGLQSRGSTGTFEIVRFSGSVDQYAGTAFVVPSDLVSISAWKLHWIDAGGSSGNVRWKLGLRVVAAAASCDAADTTAVTTVASPNSNQVLSITSLSAPSITPSPGDLVIVTLTREGSNGGDTSTGEAGLLCLELDYA